MTEETPPYYFCQGGPHDGKIYMNESRSLTNRLIFNIERADGRPTEVYSPTSEQIATSKGQAMIMKWTPMEGNAE